VINVALLGAGLMGGVHGRSYLSLGDRARVQYVYDIDGSRAIRLADELGAKAVRDPESALAADVDVATICVPPTFNRRLAELAFSRGKHVFLEKPIALTLADADAIVSAAQRSHRELMIGLVLRFWPGYDALHAETSSGKWGRALVARADRLQAPAEWGSWISDEKMSGGIAVLVMVHDFDQLNWLLGNPAAVSARALLGSGEGAQHVIAEVEYENGGWGVVEASMAMPRSYPLTSSLHCLCEHGALRYEFEAVGAGRSGDAGGAERLATSQDHVLTIYGDEAAEPERRRLESEDLWRQELTHFLDCVERGHAPTSGTGTQARSALAVALATNRSLESGRAERVEVAV
jgi:predicted dehydrogenase